MIVFVIKNKLKCVAGFYQGFFFTMVQVLEIEPKFYLFFYSFHFPNFKTTMIESKISINFNLIKIKIKPGFYLDLSRRDLNRESRSRHWEERN